MIMVKVENSIVRRLFDHLRRCISLHSDISMAPEARGYEAWPKLHYGDHAVWILIQRRGSSVGGPPTSWKLAMFRLSSLIWLFVCLSACLLVCPFVQQSNTYSMNTVFSITAR
jgi:hypothetical protein